MLIRKKNFIILGIICNRRKLVKGIGSFLILPSMSSSIFSKENTKTYDITTRDQLDMKC